MSSAEQFTGTRDEHYNLVSVLYHTLEEGDLLQRYVHDAEQSGGCRTTTVNARSRPRACC